MWNKSARQSGGKTFEEPRVPKLKLEQGAKSHIIVMHDAETQNIFQTLMRSYSFATPLPGNKPTSKIFGVPNMGDLGGNNDVVEAIKSDYFRVLKSIGETIENQDARKPYYEALKKHMPFKQNNIVPIEAGDTYVIPEVKAVPKEKKIRSYDKYDFVVAVAVLELDENDAFVIDEVTGFPKFEFRFVSCSQGVYHVIFGKTLYGIGKASLKGDSVDCNYLLDVNGPVEGILQVPDTPDAMARAQGTSFFAFGKEINKNFKAKVLKAGSEPNAMEAFPEFHDFLVQSFIGLNIDTKDIATALRQNYQQETVDRILAPFKTKLEGLTVADLEAEMAGEQQGGTASTVGAAMAEVAAEMNV